MTRSVARPAGSPPDPDLTIADVARIKRKHPQTIRRYVRLGLLPAYRVGPRDIRIRRTDLDALDRRIPAAGTG